MPDNNLNALNMGTTKPKKNNDKVKYLSLAIIAILLCVAFYFVYMQFFKINIFQDSKINGEISEFSAPISGTILNMQVEINQIAKKGQTLFELKPDFDGENNIDINMLANSLQNLYNQLKQLERMESDAQAEIEKISLEHAKILVAMRGAGQDANGTHSENSRAKEASIRLSLDQAKQKFEAISLDRASALKSYQETQIALEVAKRVNLKQNLSARAFIAPYNGKITYLNISEGAKVSTGQILLKMSDVLATSLWISASVAPEHVKSLQIGTIYNIQVSGLDLQAQLIEVGNELINGVVMAKLKLIGYDELNMPVLTVGEPVKIIE